MSTTLAFQVLFLLTCGIALVALYRLRPCTFIFAADQAIVLRWLWKISATGRPAILAYTPNWVFAEGQLQVAAWILTIAVALLGLCVWLPGSQKRLDPKALPPVPGWLLLALAAYFVTLVLATRTIFSTAYAGDDWQRFEAPIGGFQTFLMAIFLYETCRRVWGGTWSVRRGLVLIVLVLLGTDILKGMTGMAAGYMLVSAILAFGARYSRRQALVRLSVLIVAVASLVVVVRTVREGIHHEGTASLENASAFLLSPDENGSFGAESQTSGPQFAAHVLECISLYDTGRSRQWRSLVSPLIYTFEPSFLVKPLKLDRPIDAPWELGSYFPHGGGISIFGESYWNGGYLGVIVILTLVLLACYLCDSRYRSSFAWLVILLNLAPVLLQGVHYGFAYEVRGVVNGLLQLAFYRLVLPKPTSLQQETPPLMARRTV